MQKLKIKKRHNKYELILDDNCPVYDVEVVYVSDIQKNGRVLATVIVGIKDEDAWKNHNIAINTNCDDLT